MKLPKRPDHVRVMGRDYIISYEDVTLLGTDCLGRCHHAMCRIAIQNGQHPVEEADTVLHEILHAVWYCMSVAEGGADEEAVVRRLSTGLLGVFMDNPHLMTYFQDIQKLTKKG